MDLYNQGLYDPTNANDVILCMQLSQDEGDCLVEGCSFHAGIGYCIPSEEMNEAHRNGPGTKFKNTLSLTNHSRPSDIMEWFKNYLEDNALPPCTKATYG